MRTFLPKNNVILAPITTHCLCICVLNMPLFLSFFFFCFAEIEAKEACDWLRAAGFPQYAQLYEGNTHRHTQRHAHRHSSAFTQLPRFTRRLAPLEIPGFLSLTLLFFPSSLLLSLLLPSLHLCIPSSGPLRSISRLQFLSRGRGHGKGLVITAGTLTASLSLFCLPPFSFHPDLSSPTTSHSLCQSFHLFSFFLTF